MNTFRNLYLHSEYSLLSHESESDEGIFVVHQRYKWKMSFNDNQPLMLGAQAVFLQVTTETTEMLLKVSPFSFACVMEWYTQRSQKPWRKHEGTDDEIY